MHVKKSNIQRDKKNHIFSNQTQPSILFHSHRSFINDRLTTAPRQQSNRVTFNRTPRIQTRSKEQLKPNRANNLFAIIAVRSMDRGDRIKEGFVRLIARERALRGLRSWTWPSSAPQSTSIFQFFFAFLRSSRQHIYFYA